MISSGSLREVIAVAGLLERLEQREEAARRRVEGLREQAARIAEQLADAEEALNRLVITRETVDEVLAEPELESAAAAVAVTASPAGVGPVPHRTAETAVAELPVSYRDVMEVLARVDEPLRAKDVAAAVGMGESSVKAEGMRSKLNRLADRGWIIKTDAGGFTLDPVTRALVVGAM
jgi:hypothetical protein